METFYDTNIFTGIPVVDIAMLQNFDDNLLYTLSQLNQYAYDIIHNSPALRRRLYQYKRYLQDLNNEQ